MARSIYCSTCKKEKEDSVKNESTCKACKSERHKRCRIKKRLAQGLPETRPEREAYCEECKDKKNHGISISGRCNSCVIILNRIRLNEKKALEGLAPIRIRSSLCATCNLEKTNGRCLPCNNKVKQANRVERNKLKRAEQGKAPWGTRGLSPCITCGKTKEIPDKSYCNECINAKAREKWKETEAIKHNKREITSICGCGKTKSSTQRVYCDDCGISRRKEKAMMAARIDRASPDYKAPARGIYCSGCKGIKENQSSGYCNTCEREKYLLKTKPDCATCGAIKKNPRDAYCGKCKYAAIKARRPFRTYEQIFKDNVRKFTWARINDGTLIRLPCEVCGVNESVDAHHDDYHKPLDVRWLCKKHHYEHHNNEKIKDKK